MSNAESMYGSGLLRTLGRWHLVAPAEHEANSAEGVSPLTRESRGSMPAPTRLAALLAFLVTLLLMSGDLLPEYNDINPYDETMYIDSGRSLVLGEVRDLAWGPLVAVVYAPLYLAVQRSPDWFLLLAGFGRMALFGLLWLSCYTVAGQFDRYVHPLVVAGFLLISASCMQLLSNPSDALFASLSAFALSRILAYGRFHRLGDLYTGSACMGLASLSRNDGLFLLPIFLGLALWQGLKRERATRLGAALAGPFLAVFAFYAVASILSSGSFRPDLSQRSYSAFEWSQDTLPRPSDTTAEAEVRRLYGTPEENGNSVLRAIARNPRAFLDRVLYNATHLPDTLLIGYGKRIAPILFLLAAAGIYFLVRQKDYSSIVMLILWPIPVLLYLGFYLRAGFYLMPYFVPTVLAAIGLSSLIREVDGVGRRFLWSIPFLALAIYGWVDNKLAFLLSGVVTLFALMLAWLQQGSDAGNGRADKAALLIALCGGLIIHGDFPFPSPWGIGETTGERAVAYLQQELPHGAKVATPKPLPAVAARMTRVDLADAPSSPASLVDFEAWLRGEGVSALVVDPEFIHSYPDTWLLIEAGIGEFLEVGLVADPGSIQILLVKGAP